MRSTDFIQNSCFIGGEKRTSKEVLFHQLITVKTKIRIQNSLLSIQPALLWWMHQVVKQRLCSTNMNAFLHPPKSVLHPLPPSLWSCYTPKHPPVPVSIYWSLSHPSKNHLQHHFPNHAVPHGSLHMSFLGAYCLSHSHPHRVLFLITQWLNQSTHLLQSYN